MKRLLGLIGLLIISGCATTPERREPVNVVHVFNLPFDQVWRATVAELAGSYPFEILDQSSGTIQTKELGLHSGYTTQNFLDEFTYRPRVLLATWSAAKGQVFITITPLSESRTQVRVRTQFQGLENNVTHTWYLCESNGKLEQQILDRIQRSVGQNAVSFQAPPVSALNSAKPAGAPAPAPARVNTTQPEAPRVKIIKRHYP